MYEEGVPPGRPVWEGRAAHNGVATGQTAVVTPSDAFDINAIANALRDILGKGGVLPAERLLAEQLNVTRHRLRQALERLRADNEIEPQSRRRVPLTGPHGEAMVRSTNPLEVIEMRMILEPALARLAAIRASPEEIGRIARAASTGPGSQPGQADLVFHRLVAAGARNGLGTDLYGLLRTVGRDARLRVGTPQSDNPAQVARRDTEHQRIAKAIAERNPDDAEAAMRGHLLAVQERILVWLAPGPTKS